MMYSSFTIALHENKGSGARIMGGYVVKVKFFLTDSIRQKEGT